MRYWMAYLDSFGTECPVISIKESRTFIFVFVPKKYGFLTIVESPCFNDIIQKYPILKDSTHFYRFNKNLTRITERKFIAEMVRRKLK